MTLLIEIGGLKKQSSNLNMTFIKVKTVSKKEVECHCCGKIKKTHGTQESERKARSHLKGALYLWIPLVKLDY